VDRKTTLKWAWPGSRDPISKFWDPLITFERIVIELSASNLNSTGIKDEPSLRRDFKTTPKWAWPGSRDPISQFWDPSYNFGRNRAIRFKFGTDIEDRPLRRVDHKRTPKWAWPASRDPISKCWNPLITFERIELSASNLVWT